MQGHRFSTWLLSAGLVAGFGRISLAQTSTSPVTRPAATSSTTSQPAAKKTNAHRRTVRRTASHSAVTTIPMETAPPTPVTATSLSAEARQRTADDRLLAQQQAQSQRAAQVTDATVQRAVQQQQSVQNESRIQDAPGPAQTGIVPASGSPVQPNNNDVRIQDAPGPSQTNPQPAATKPVAPATPPPQI